MLKIDNQYLEYGLKNKSNAYFVSAANTADDIESCIVVMVVSLMLPEYNTSNGISDNCTK